MSGDRLKFHELANDDSETMANIRSQFEARASLMDLSEAVQKGSATDAEFVEVGDSIKAILSESKQSKLASILESLKTKNEVIQFLEMADTSMIGQLTPSDGESTLIEVPNAPLGSFISLGSGVFIVAPKSGEPLNIRTGNLLSHLGVRISKSAPVSNQTENTKSEISISNPTASTFRYTLNGSAFTMEPKYEQHLDSKQKWTIRYDQGNGRGIRVEDLTRGPMSRHSPIMDGNCKGRACLLRSTIA